MTKPLIKVNDISPNLGCDPEFFFKSKGEVIGAEKVLPKAGLVRLNTYGVASKFIIDGVQAELNPAPNNCRANLGNEIKACFSLLNKELKKRKDGLTAAFSRTVEISKENLMQLHKDSRKFGCAPSKSIYKKLAGIKIDAIDPAEYRTRAAGGHIHIGKGYGNPDKPHGLYRALTVDHSKTVAMLDLLCGNTAVLVDRDEGNIERRKVYGKAGEFRLPEHGLEYRTLSNFWLTSYPLMSFVFGMARLAVQLIADEPRHKEYFDAFTSKVKPKKVKDAINNNDFELAVDNFHAIEELIIQVSQTNSRHAIHANNMTEFKHFVNTIQTKGLNYWFPQDPMTHWTSVGECHTGGFHDFLLREVHNDMVKSKKAA